MKPITTSKVIVFCLATLVLLFGFQNCSTRFQAQQFSSSRALQTSLPPDDPITDPIIHPPAPEPQITMTESQNPLILSAAQMSGSPAEGIILQRKSDNKVILTILPELSALDVQFFRYKIISPTGQQVSTAVKYVGGTAVSIPVAAAMARLSVQLQFFDRTGIEVARGTTKNFLVGDVFIVGGQSNAANHGQTETKSTNPLNSALYPQFGTWVELADPLPFASNWKLPQFGSRSYFGGSPWPTFADAVSANTGVPVGMASVAWGGSSVNEWLVGGNADYTQYSKEQALVNYMIIAAKRMPDCGFSAVLWHQGETDSLNGTPKATYVAKMIQLRNKFVQETGCSKPWIIAQASYMPPLTGISVSAMAQISQAQQELWQVSGFMEGPNTDLLIGSQYRFDEVHFNLAGLKLHGQLWADKVLSGMSLKKVSSAKATVK